MAGVSRGSRTRRTEVFLVLCGLALVLVGLVLCVALTRGTDFIVRFFTKPSLEAGSGRKYTPAGAVKRKIEKMGEKEKK